MAVKPITRTVTIPASGHISFAEILGRPENTWMGSAALRAARANSYDIHWHDEDGQSGGFVGPGEAVTMSYEGQALIKNVNLSGTAGDIVYVTIDLSRHYFGDE